MQRRYDDAVSAQKQVVEIRKESFGPEHILTINSISHLASTLTYQGRHEEAEAAKILVLETRREILGPRHLRMILAMSNPAATRYEQRAL